MSKENLVSMVNLARSHVDRGAVRAAEVYYRMILKASDPPTTAVERVACGEACWFFAARSIADGRHGAACDWYQRSLDADPLCVDYRLDYIIKALFPMGMFKNAKIVATQATKIEPKNPDAWRALAIACAAMGDAEESAAAYDRQVELDPDNPLARLDRASLAINVGDYETVRKMVDPIMDSSVRGDVLHTMAVVAYRESKHEEAIDLFKQSLEAGVQDPEQVKWNMSLAMCAIGRYAEGFELAEARGKQKADQPMRLVMNRLNAPVLTRDTLHEPCRVHVHQEMGNGDAIATARYLDMLVDLGHTVQLETMESMVDLLQRSFPRVKVMPRALDYPGAASIPPFPAFDKQITTLSLPYLFGTDIDSIPWRGPYIKANPELVDKYDRLLPVTSAKRRIEPRRVGLCWSSGIRTDGLWISRYGKKKSMHFDDLRPLWTKSGNYSPCRNNLFVSLQIGPEREQMHDPVLDVLPVKPSWDETAALIANLDVVVTVDTAVAHLAGAMGKPTYLMMQKDGASWHFMCERPGAAWNTRSPWYPSSFRIFRQTREGEWSDVVERVAQELMEAASLAS